MLDLSLKIRHKTNLVVLIKSINMLYQLRLVSLPSVMLSTMSLSPLPCDSKKTVPNQCILELLHQCILATLALAGICIQSRERAQHAAAVRAEVVPDDGAPYRVVAPPGGRFRCIRADAAGPRSVGDPLLLLLLLRDEYGLPRLKSAQKADCQHSCDLCTRLRMVRSRKTYLLATICDHVVHPVEHLGLRRSGYAGAWLGIYDGRR